MSVFNRERFLQFIGLQYLLDQKMPRLRSSQFVKPLARLVAVTLAGILFNLISNRVSNIEQFENVSEFMILVRFLPLSFFHYKLLSITTVIVCCIGQWVGDQIFMEWKDTERLPQDVRPLDSQGVGPYPPQDTRPPQDIGPSHLIGQPQLQVTVHPCPLSTGLAHSQVLGASQPNATEQPQPRGTGPPHPQGTGPSRPQVTGSDTQMTGASHPHPRTTEPLDLGILDHDLRGLFYHLKQHYRFPAPTMSTSSRIKSISYVQTSSGTMAFTVHMAEVDMTEDMELVFEPVLILPTGSKVFYRPFQIGPQTGFFEMEDFRKMVLESLSRARILDPECTLQFGSFAVLKYTESGLKWWRLQNHWIPTISDIRFSWNLFHSLRRSRRKWIIKGFNLETAMMKASTVDEIEYVKVFQRCKMESGEDALFCEEPDLVQNSALMFRKKVYICASNSVEVQEGVVFNVQSEPINVKKAYWVSVIESLIPSRWTVIIVLGLSVLKGLTYGARGIVHDGLSSKIAPGHVGLSQDHDINTVDINLTWNSLLHTLSEIYSFLLVYIVVIVTPIFISTFGQLSRQQIRQLGSYLLRFRRTRPLKDTSNVPSPTFAIPTTSNSSVEEENLKESLVDFQEEADDVSDTGHGAGGQELYRRHVLDRSLTIPMKELGGPVRGAQYERNRPGLVMMDSINRQGENKEKTTSVEGHLQEDADTVNKTGQSEFMKQRRNPFDILNEEISEDGALQDPSHVGSSSSGLSLAGDNLGWVDFQNNPESGDVSYPNTYAGNSRSELPSVKDVDTSVSPPLPSLPPDWKEATAVGTGHTYYYNLKTIELSWERPKAEMVFPDQDIKQENSSTGPSSGYDVASDFTNSAAYESIEKEANTEEHGDNVLVRQHRAPLSEDFGDTSDNLESPYLNEDESKNLKIKPIEGGLGDVCVPQITPLSENFGYNSLNRTLPYPLEDRLEKTMTRIEDEDDKSKSVLDHSISDSYSGVGQDNNDDHSGKKSWWRPFRLSGNQNEKKMRERSFRSAVDDPRGMKTGGRPFRKGQLKGMPIPAMSIPGASSQVPRFWQWRLNRRRHQQDADLIRTLMESNSVMLMPLRSLKKATENFADSKRIGEGGFGEGGFGTVYRGILQDGTEVAIKRRKGEGSHIDKEQILNEVRILSQVHHRHLVKLMGCCMEDNVALLVFEFVSNGTLKEYLQDGHGLSWNQRLDIAVQSAEALNYLHSAATPPIYHRDFNSASILLNNDLSAKVAGFGISKLAPVEATHVSTTAVQGTLGYIDPEYYTSYQLTDKSDVYSFGVVLLELVSAKPAIDFQRGGEISSLVTFATPHIKSGDVQPLIDLALMGTYSNPAGRESILSVAGLALNCLETRSKARPSMNEVLKELQNLRLRFNLESLKELRNP